MKKLMVFAIAMCMIAAMPLVSCADPANDDSGAGETEEVTETGENTETEMDSEMVKTVAEILDCPERTAEGICKKFGKSIDEELISIVQIEDPYSTVLEMTGQSGRKYYAVIEPGYFLSRIVADSLEGEQLYIAIR
ncbi:MAG: hypothetical protein E7230_03315 [Clostridiales bacterium]|nr:hypothetical protein [Clostridiales bacterium]MBR0469520.1 hypothetical protein [Mogibacterium sp.]